MQKMSSISAQGVVERASAELSKRINGLGLRSKHHHGHSGKTSVMERVTNALCGGSSHNSASIGAPEKPSRVAQSATSTGSSSKQLIVSSKNGNGSQQSTPQANRKAQQALIPLGSGASGHGQTHSLHQQQLPAILTIEQLFQDERFLNKFFQYFTSFERRNLAQVCTRWRDIMYRCPRYWSGLLPVLQCRELRQVANQDRVKLYNSLIRRGFHAVCLLSATDEDALDIVHSFPLASKHVHSLSLRCSSISDRGLEALLDHLQVSNSLEKLLKL